MIIMSANLPSNGPCDQLVALLDPFVVVIAAILYSAGQTAKEEK